MKKYLGLGGAAAGGIAALAIVGVALGFGGLQNGSFESGPPVGSFVQVNPGTTIDGWTVEVAVDYIGTYFQASDGNRSLDMNASPSQGVISQTVGTVVGATYDVAFDLSGNPACARGPKVLRVSATGADPLDVTFDTLAEGNTLINMKWRQETYSFVATSTSTTVSFASQVGSNCGPALDNVRMTETLPPPPPPAYTAEDCKKGGWQGMTDHLSNRFKNQGDCVSYFATQTRNLGAIKP